MQRRDLLSLQYGGSIIELLSVRHGAINPATASTDVLPLVPLPVIDLRGSSTDRTPP